MRNMRWMIAYALLITGAAMAEIITIDEQYNGGPYGNYVVEYRAFDTTNPYDIASSGDALSYASLAAGSSSTALDRQALCFTVPSGYTSAQITNAVLKFRLNAKNGPTTDLDIYSAHATTLGTEDATFAKAMFSNSSFADTGLGFGTNATIGIYYCIKRAPPFGRG